MNLQQRLKNGRNDGNIFLCTGNGIVEWATVSHAGMIGRSIKACSSNRKRETVHMAVNLGKFNSGKKEVLQQLQ